MMTFIFLPLHFFFGVLLVKCNCKNGHNNNDKITCVCKGTIFLVIVVDVYSVYFKLEVNETDIMENESKFFYGTGF